MDPRMAWGSVAALGLSLAAFALVAPGRPGPLAVSLLGWATLGVAVVVFGTGVWGYRARDPESERVAFGDYSVITVAVLVVLVTVVYYSL